MCPSRALDLVKLIDRAQGDGNELSAMGSRAVGESRHARAPRVDDTVLGILSSLLRTLLAGGDVLPTSKGSVDHLSEIGDSLMQATGWLATPRGEPVKSVVVVDATQGGLAVVGAGDCHIDRLDVAEYLGTKRSAAYGYRVALRLNEVPDAAALEVIGIAEDGTILRYVHHIRSEERVPALDLVESADGSVDDVERPAPSEGVVEAPPPGAEPDAALPPELTAAANDDRRTTRIASAINSFRGRGRARH